MLIIKIKTPPSAFSSRLNTKICFALLRNSELRIVIHHLRRSFNLDLQSLTEHLWWNADDTVKYPYHARFRKTKYDHYFDNYAVIISSNTSNKQKPKANENIGCGHADV